MIYVIGEKNQRQTLALLTKVSEIAEQLGKNPVKFFYDTTDTKRGENRFETFIINEIQKEKPDYIFLPSTPYFREFAAKITVKASAAMLTDCISFNVKEESLEAIRPSLDGNTLSHYTFSKDAVAVIVVKDTGNTENPLDFIEDRIITCPFVADSTPSSVLEDEISREKLAGEVIPVKKITHPQVRKDIKEATLIFAGGRGLMNEESFKELRELAALFHASVGASRPVVDCGWADPSEQVGQTGSFVHPKIYIAFGISGAIQHLAGMKDSDCIIAVNSNPRSPVFQYCDYGIYADANSIIRNMLQIFRKTP